MSRIYSILFFLYSNLKSHLDDYTLTFDKSNWSYDSTNDVYYQIGVFYCSNLVATAIFRNIYS